MKVFCKGPKVAGAKAQERREEAALATPARPYARRREERGRRRRQSFGRTGLLLAAVALPTVAAQGEWSQLAWTIDGDETIALEPMPFETAGQSFPGSAFYYLEDVPRALPDLAGLRRSEAGGETVTFAESHGAGVGAAAQAFRQAGDGIDKARALQCLSLAVYYEAASESYAGQQAVAQVVLNRVAHPAYPASVCGVVFQGSERRTGCQFTFTCDGSLNRNPSRRGWALAQSVALAALAGEVYEPVGLATHYHTNYVNPYWAASLDYIGPIGAHRFYRWKGRAGNADAFTDAYSGGEPLAAPALGRPAPIPGPVAPAPPPNSAIGATQLADTQVGAPAPAPGGPAPAASPSDRLPRAGRVKQEYANSGRWLKQPGG